MPATNNAASEERAIKVFGSKERMHEVLAHFYPILKDLLKQDSFACEEIVRIVIADPITLNEAERLYIAAKIGYHCGDAHARGVW